MNKYTFRKPKGWEEVVEYYTEYHPVGKVITAIALTFGIWALVCLIMCL